MADEINNAPEQPLIETQPADTIGTAGPMQQAGVTAPEPEAQQPVAKHPTEVKTQRHVQKNVAGRTTRPTNEALNPSTWRPPRQAVVFMPTVKRWRGCGAKA